MACPPTVCAEVGVRPASTFLDGKRTATTPRTVHLHWVEPGGGGKSLAGRGGGKEPRGGVGFGRWGLLLGMGAGRGGSGLVVFHGDGRGHIILEDEWEGPLRGKLETNPLFKFSGKEVDEGVIWPAGIEGVGDVLESNC